MSQFTAQIFWQNSGPDFAANKYSRAHQWEFDGGLRVAASASPEIVPLPWSVAENVDPEEAFVASLASCHMLFFLSIAAKQGYTVQNYSDNASGVMAKNSEGRMVITDVTLRPRCVFVGSLQPDNGALENLHHRAHELCFIANSVKTQVHIEIDSSVSSDSA